MLRRLALAVTLALSTALGPGAPLGALPAAADSAAQTLPFSQAWSTTTLITTTDDWSGVPGLVGYLGTDLTNATGTDPQTILADGTDTPVDVIANQANPNTQTGGGVAEFDGLADPVVALQGSGTADAPFVLLSVDTTGLTNIVVAYRLRDIDGAADNAVQPVALHYRLGSSGSFTNVPAGYVADASTGPSLATLVTPITVTLPVTAEDQALVQIRLLTTNAAGSDEWIGIDDLTVTGTSIAPDLAVAQTGPATAAAGETITYTLTLANAGLTLATGVLLTDTLGAGATLLTYTTSLPHTFAAVAADTWQWAVGDLPGLTSGALITVVAALSPTLTTGQVVTNAVSAGTTGSETRLANNAAALATTIDNPAPEVFVLKTGATLAVAGAPFTYTLVYGNRGDLAAAAVWLTDTLPAGFGAAALLTDTSGLTATEGAHTRAWAVGTLAPGSQYTFTLALTVPPTVTSGLRFTNTADIVTATPGDSAVDNVSAAAATGYAQVTIAAIQTVGNPSVSGASPLAGQTVWVEGVVTAERGDVETNNRAMVIEAPGGGPWSGLYVFRSAGLPADPAAPEGALVRLLGTVAEFNGLTELSLGTPYSLEVLSLGHAGPGPDLLATGDYISAATAEQWESVFIRFEAAAVVTPNIGNGEWTLDDGSGAATADDLGDADGDLSYGASSGDVYRFIQGIGYYSFGAYKLVPRSAADIDLWTDAPRLVKTGPALTAPGSLFTYTLTVTNPLGLTLTGLVITDAVPPGATFAYAADGGALAGGTVSWTVASLSPQSGVSVRFAVTATTALTTIVNSQYGVQAANYLTPGVGSPYRTVVGDHLHVRDIQGAGHRSPFVGQVVTGLVGVVTAVDGGGYYLQDPDPDGDEATSEAIFVDTVGASGRSVGELLVISGTVAEYYPDGASASGLSVTQLDPPFTLVISSTGHALPPPVVVGAGGRVPPNTVLDDDATGNVETSGSFDAATDGLDFWESLEAMRVQVNDALVVAGTRSFGELTVVGDGGANAGLLSPRGALVLRATDANPERLMIDDGLLPTPVVNAGAYFTAPIVGVLDYSFGNFKLQATTLPAPNPGALVSETTALTRTAEQLTLATVNVENLDPGDPPAKFAALAERIVNHLLAPDLIAVEEMQDNNGATDDTVVAADLTFGLLISAVVAVGGPVYAYRQINPANDQDGGEPGGNIRVGFLFRTDRGLSFVDRPGGTATAATGVVLGPDGPQLTYSPGRINPGSSAFDGSRKPLAGEFVFNGARLLVIANHWNSKGGDDALAGRYQPPYLGSQAQRLLQAQAVNDFVDAVLALDPHANLVVLGDLNDFHFSPPLATLMAGGVLTTLVTTLPENERYSYVYEGNAQVLDHILVSPNVFAHALAGFDVVHVNAEFAYPDQASDHDPSLARLTLTPGRLAGSVKSVNALSVTAGSWLTYTLTVSNSGGASVSFALTDTLAAGLTLISAPGLSGSTTLTAAGLLAPYAQQVYTITVQVAAGYSGPLTNTATLSGDGQTRALAAPTVTVAAHYGHYLPLVFSP